MSVQIITDLLSRVEIFHEIPDLLLRQLAGRLNIDTIKAGTTIIPKGAEGDSMFVIAQGNVKVHDGEHTVATMEAGNFFGEFS
ncbi:MAG: cyclic nucleotide-binding domain-containing protein, partial [Bacteroidetes bacterium]|nr:cyclic nucleotide-binding domain-containing protein [Bacteroidota bacterium]